MSRERTGHAARRVVTELTEPLWHLLTTGTVAEESWESFFLPEERGWERYSVEILRRWVVERPGTRPWAWWRYDAPRWSDDPFEGWWLHGTLPAPRRRLGGRGDPIFEVLNYSPEFAYGIPAKFIDAATLEFYAEHMPPAPDNWVERRPAISFDPDDPPVYESQAAYLDRHRLMDRAEWKAAAKLGLLDATEVVHRDADGVAA